MRITLLAAMLALCCASPSAQTPAANIFTSPLGFSYTLPPGWTVIKAQPAAPSANPPLQKPTRKKRKVRGTNCARDVFTARHGNPASVVAVVVLPFACYGKAITARDFSHFNTGVAEGLKQHFQISNPVYGSYKLGSHRMWIERAKGTPKNHPGSQYTVEIACGLLNKGAVCWMTMAATAGNLQAFENGAVTLEGEPATALVPANAFAKKPS